MITPFELARSILSEFFSGFQTVGVTCNLQRIRGFFKNHLTNQPQVNIKVGENSQLDCYLDWS